MTNVDRVELTASQRGGWVAQNLVSVSTAFGAGQAIWLNGAVDPPGFAAAVELVFTETDALRVRFGDDDGVPFQYVDTSKVLHTKIVDSEHDDVQVREMARRQLVEMPRSSAEPSTCSTLIRRSDGTWAWLLTTNVLLSDGYGVSLFTRRVAEVYGAMQAGAMVPGRWFGSLKEVVDTTSPANDLDTSLGYWEGVLGIESVDRQDSAESFSEVFTFSYQPSTVPIRDDTYAQIQKLARTLKVSWTDLLIASWGVYTASAEGHDHVAVRVPMMLRDSRESLRTPSAVSRAIPVAVKINPYDGFADVVEVVAEQLKESRRHTSVEDHQIARLWPGGQASYLALPTVNIRLFEAMPRFGAVVANSETISPGPVGSVDLAVYRDPDSGVRLEVSANDAAGGSLLHAEQFGQFLDEAIHGSPARTLYELRAGSAPNVDGPYARVSDVAVEEARDVGACAFGGLIPIPDVTLDQLVREQAALTSDLVAVVDDANGTEFTYAVFDARVNALAQLLVDRGVRIGDRVGVLLPRSADLVVTLAGIIRAGAAYVPVGTTYPGERVSYILSDAQVAAVISDIGMAASYSKILAGIGAPILRVDEQGVRNVLRRGLPEAPTLDRPILPDDAVYTIYTSGTTGRPKGVQLSHRAVVNRLEWGRRELGFTATDRVLLKTAVTFDVSVPEFFLPLIVGASIIVAQDEMHGDPDYIARTLREHEVTSVHFVPSMLQAFIDSQPSAGSFPTVRLVSFTGEALPAGAALDARRLFASAALFNLYGPTEAAIEIGSYPISELPADAGSTPIGLPISNSSFIVLDSWLRPCRFGAVGELYLGGAQVADGYFGRHALTAERFVADPFGSTGERLYRTGDLARWNSEGQLEYLGRIDDQVKIRGHRIELDEIRHTLETSDFVSGAAVVPLDHPAGGKYIAAYVTIVDDTRGNETMLVESLRAHAAASLPEYMVPATVTVLGAFPVTSNGKLDRSALPVPDLGATAAGGRAPESGTEKTVAGVFIDVLHLPQDTDIRVDDDFFRLGGHSLLATRVVARVNAAMGSALSLRDVFEHPTIGGLAAFADNDLGSAGRGSVVQVGDLSRPDVLPVSFGQQSLWLIDQFGGPGPRYVVPTVLRMSGNLNEAALGRAVRDVVARHEALRTLLLEEGGQLRQVILPAEDAAAALPLVAEDYTAADEAAVDARVEELVQQRFDLAADVPVRASLLRTGSSEWVLALAVHHHAVDEWSLPSLLRDLSTAYQARADGEQPGWAPLPVQYADYAVWQREALGDPADPNSEVSKHLQYWLETLKDAPEESTISLDRARPVEPSHRGKDIGFTIDPDTVSGLRQVADEQGVTTFMIAQAATALAVSVLSGAEDMVIGSPAGGRTADGLEDLVGYFVNTLPIRHRLHPTDTIIDVLQRTRDTVLGGFAHQAAPFEQIVGAVGVDRSTNRNPLYQIMLTHQVRQEEAPLRFGDAIVTPRQASLGAVKADIDLYLADTPAGITGTFAYATDLYDHSTAERFLAVLQNALRAIAAAHPTRSLADLRLVPGDETDLTDRVHGGKASLPTVTLDGPLRAQASATPDEVALIDDHTGIELTYAEFDAQVNALARLLIDRGVGIGDRVGVLLPRSADLVVTLAGIIRAGAAYVPVDPSYPGDRVSYILSDSQVSAVISDICTAEFHNDALASAGVPVLRMDEQDLRDVLRRGLPDAPTLARPVLPDDAVYAIYTSGTTGRPKGVQLSHRAVMNRLEWGRAELGFTASDRVLLKTAVTFDVSVPEFFLPLIVGASIVVAQDEMHGDPEYIARVLREHEVTSVHFVPSMLQTFLDNKPAAGSFPTVRLVSFTGEALPAPAARAARALFSSARLFNLYGPTEAAIEIGSYDIAGVAEAATSTPIGLPISNSAFLVLDSWLRPAAPGVVGELYLGGVQLADGYVGRHALTAERFVADPFGSTGERLYRTGDLARWNSEGQLEYLGRIDDQVKIRGHRIELDEIRNVLETHPVMSGAVVVALDHPAGGKYLAAYVTFADAEAVGDESAPTQVVQDHASASLPDYMVPTTVTVLDAFPVTSNGKLDRKALPAPDLGAAMAGGRAPDSDTEQGLASVFADVLRLGDDATLSVDDDFFRLGGHSLLATRVVARANTALDSALTLRDVFDHPTVAGLASIVDAAVEAGDRASGLRVGDLVRPGVLPVSFGQQSLWLIDQLGGPGGRYVVPVIRRLSGDLDEQALGQAVRDVISRHEALRTLIVEEEAQLRQVIVPADQATASLALATEDFVGTDEAAVDARVAELVQQNFDLARDIPVRVGLLRSGSSEWVLVLVLHHHAVDEWSLPSLLGDLSTAYQARVAGEVPGWVPLPVQYADYALWQREVLGDSSDPASELSRHLQYWQEVLVDAPEESTLNLDRARPVEPTHRGADISFTIAPDTVAGLRKVADELGVTTFVIAQAATALAVSALSGTDDVVIGSPVGGRTGDGVEDLVGYFVNTLPFRHRLHPTDTLTDLLRRTRNTVLDGFAHQAAPFEEIIRAVGGERSTNRNPLFQVILTHHIRPEQQDTLRFGDAEVTNRPAPLGAVKTDLDLYLTDNPTEITGFLSYATDLYNRETIDLYVAVFHSVLDTIVTAPERRVIDLDLLQEAKHQQTRTWSTGEVLDIPEVTLDAWMRAQAALTPDALAVVDELDGAKFTFAELDARVSALASLLVEQGVQIGSRVGVLLPRSAGLVVTLAAAVRAGAAYVPIDPEYPAERVRKILEDASPALVVTDTTTAEAHASKLDDVTLIRLDDAIVSRALRRGGADVPVLSRPLTRHDDAYVIFTSGTTGRPKGVSVSHGAIVNRLMWGNCRLGLDETSVVLAKSGVGFVDASTELLGPLVAGGTVRILPDPAAKDPRALREVIREHQVTHLLTVPTLGEALAEQTSQEDLVSLRHWVSSGERLAPAVRDKLRAAAPEAALHDFYGSTEVTGDATASEASDGPTSIGGPVANTTVHVLDTWLRPVAVGVVGELYVGGAQLAHGYVSDTAMTADRFVADPFSQTGERLYRSGDLVRWNTHGELEILGRSDDQVKIRGYRIEPDEIRNTLRKHSLVTSAEVVPFEHPAGGQRLAVYVTLTGDGANHSRGTERTIRGYLEARLPEYMVPDAIIILDALPTTPHGKLDRRALPDPRVAVTSTGGREASTAVEQTLIKMFRETLRLGEGTQLSVDDDFFRLGGDSILAARVAALAQRQGLSVTLRDIFERRTVTGLAAASEAGKRADAEPTGAPASPTLSALRESGDDPNAWVLTESVTLPAGAARVRRAFLGLVDAIDSMRLRVNPANKRLWLQEVLPPGAADATAQWVDAPEGLSEPQLRELAVERVDVLAGLPVAAAASESGNGLNIVVAVHAAAADHRSVHELVGVLVADGPLPRFVSVVARLETIDAAGVALDPSNSDAWLADLDHPIDESALDAGGFATFEFESGLTVSAVRDAAARAAAAVTAPSRASHPAVAVEVDLRDVAAEGDPGTRVLGAFTASSPLPHGEPVAAGVDPAEFPLLRYHNREGRRALRKAAEPAVLVTRQYGALPDPRVREGVERTYRVVVRYHLGHYTTRVTVIGLSAESATAFERRMRAETAGPSAAGSE